ncbi:MAG: FliM/FliN family flagellar motor switch protein [Endozoicomonas sp. (ex Botrylloides leachii)]|nr:FliM/FliN family flagellar motor switch protein [Endozoicomonas sp. (ex Botrylloides leachii)]
MERKSAPTFDGRKVSPVKSDTQLGDVEAYDLSSQKEKIEDFLPTLQVINKRCSQLLHHGISSLFRTDVAIHFSHIDAMQISEYQAAEFQPDLTYTYSCKSLRCSGFMAMESPLLVALVDIFYGGTGETGAELKDELSTAEIRIFKQLLEVASEKQAQAWSAVAEFKAELSDNYNTPISTLFHSDTETVLVSEFIMQVGEHSSRLHMVVPYQALEPIKDDIQAFKVIEQDPCWKKNMLLGLLEVPLELSAHLCEFDLSLNDVLRLAPGQIIQTDIPQQLTMKVAGIPGFIVEPCTVRDNMGIKIVENILTPPEDNRTLE